MTDQKAENLLNLALSTPEEERMQTDELNVGFDSEAKTWEVIVTYSGNLQEIVEQKYPQVSIKELLGGFAILKIPESLIEEVIQTEEIEYVEKPKKLYFAVNRAKAASCFLPVQKTNIGADHDIDKNANETDRLHLSGSGVLIAVVDSGIDYFHDDFRNPDGSTRILFLYDQVLNRVFTKEEIDRALKTGNRAEARELVPSFDPSGHGTAVAGIAAGNGKESAGRYRGAAYDSDLIIVKLGVSDPNGFPRTTQVMDGLDFVIRKAQELRKPVAVNLSFGNSYGSHDGSGLFERYIDRLSEIGKSVFVIGAGNEGDKSGHVGGKLSNQKKSEDIELSVAPYEPGFGVQLWKNYEDVFDVYLTNPAGTITEQIRDRNGAYEIKMGSTRVLVYYGEPGPFSESQELYFDFLSEDGAVESGIWNITLQPVRIVDGRYDLWLPTSGAVNRSTRFLRADPDSTLTIPSTASRPITVGAYNDAVDAYAAFSGRGPASDSGLIKPDLVAPGVNVIAPKRGGGYEPVTGTSFAAPLVTGAAALLMEWGIIDGNDPYLYGDKVKAYLKRGARPLPGENRYPNSKAGWGKLCVADSIPSIYKEILVLKWDTL